MGVIKKPDKQNLPGGYIQVAFDCWLFFSLSLENYKV